MCEFCENITNRDKEIIWNVRSTYADDNICEFVNDNNCSVCEGCFMHFKLSGYKSYDEDIYVGVEYNQELTSSDGKKVYVRPFSETIQFNYCPICGKQISKNIKEFGKYYSNQISINDSED